MTWNSEVCLPLPPLYYDELCASHGFVGAAVCWSAVLGIKLRAISMLGKHSAPELQPQPQFLSYLCNKSDKLTLTQIHADTLLRTTRNMLLSYRHRPSWQEGYLGVEGIVTCPRSLSRGGAYSLLFLPLSLLTSISTSLMALGKEAVSDPCSGQPGEA